MSRASETSKGRVSLYKIILFSRFCYHHSLYPFIWSLLGHIRSPISNGWRPTYLHAEVPRKIKKDSCFSAFKRTPVSFSFMQLGLRKLLAPSTISLKRLPVLIKPLIVSLLCSPCSWCYLLFLKFRLMDDDADNHQSFRSPYNRSFSVSLFEKHLCQSFHASSSLLLLPSA